MQDVSNQPPREVTARTCIMSHLNDAKHLMMLGSAWSIHEAQKRVDFANFILMAKDNVKTEIDPDVYYKAFVERFPAKEFLPLNYKEEPEEVPTDPVYWTAPVGGFDDYGSPIRDFIIDGKTKEGPWALMTLESWEKYGAYKTFGTGKGQKYKRQEDGRWLKIEG